MTDYVSGLLAAERGGRMLALMQQPTYGDEWIIDIGHGPDACALMAAGRWAARFGATVCIRLPEQGDDSQIWKELLGSSETQNMLLPDERHSRGEASLLTITQAGTGWEVDELPDDSLAWRTPLVDAAPLVTPVSGSSRRLSVEQCRMVDTLAVQKYHIPSLCLMENAAAGAASVLLNMVARPRSVLILAGGGNNGGDGLALARGLDSQGIHASLALFKHPKALRGDALVNYHQLKIRPTVPIHYLADRPGLVKELLDQSDLIVDGLLGTGFSGALSPSVARVIDLVNASDTPVLALDLPSGMNGETGKVEETAIICKRTVTFAAMKPGLEAPGAAEFTGDCYIAEIGVPRQCLEIQQS